MEITIDHTLRRRNESDEDGPGIRQANPGGQHDFYHDWKHKYTALEGGWSSGKTFIGAAKLLKLHLHNSLDARGRPTFVPSLCIAPTLGNAKEYDIPALVEIGEEWGLYPEYVANHRKWLTCVKFPKMHGGLAPILIRTADKPERITGFQVGSAWGDEAARWKSDEHDPLRDPITQLIGRVRHPKARMLRILFTYTNEGDNTAIFKRFHDSEKTHNHALYRAVSFENQITAEWAEETAAELTPELREQYIMGGAAQLRGAKVYAPYDADVHWDASLKLDNSRPICMTCDFNISPGMHGLVGHYDQGADVFEVVHELHRSRMSVVQMVEALVRVVDESGGYDPDQPIQVYYDTTGKAEWAGTGESCVQIMRDALTKAGLPYKLRMPQGNPPVIDRVNAVNVALADVSGNVHMKIHPSCKRLIADLRDMKRDEYGEISKDDKKLSHSSDALGYWVHRVRPCRTRVQRKRNARFNFT